MKRLALAVALLIGLATPSQADFREGLAAYLRGDYATALQELKPLAEQGDSDAQFMLGQMYNDGLGVPQDYAEAAKWYRKAAEQGYAGAQYNLGRIYGKDYTVFTDTFEGEIAYLSGDYATAFREFEPLAEQGNALAQYFLGTMYAVGQNVPRDLVRAHMWFDLAASRLGASPLQKIFFQKLAIKLREEVAALMTPAQIAEAQRLAREWKPKEGGK